MEFQNPQEKLFFFLFFLNTLQSADGWQILSDLIERWLKTKSFSFQINLQTETKESETYWNILQQWSLAKVKLNQIYK